MRGFILETVQGTTCNRLGKIFWTEAAAHFEAKRLVNRQKANVVRILVANVGSDAIATVARTEGGAV